MTVNLSDRIDGIVLATVSSSCEYHSEQVYQPLGTINLFNDCIGFNSDKNDVNEKVCCSNGAGMSHSNENAGKITAMNSTLHVLDVMTANVENWLEMDRTTLRKFTVGNLESSATESGCGNVLACDDRSNITMASIREISVCC